MKRLISATLALSLFGATAAAAAPYDRGDNGYSHQGYDNGYRGHDNGGAVVAGVGLLALAAIIAAQNHQHYHSGWHHGWYDRGGDRYGHNYGYGSSYGSDYGRSYNSH
jgi:hypothetical protein